MWASPRYISTIRRKKKKIWRKKGNAVISALLTRSRCGFAAEGVLARERKGIHGKRDSAVFLARQWWGEGGLCTLSAFSRGSGEGRYGSHALPQRRSSGVLLPSACDQFGTTQQANPDLRCTFQEQNGRIQTGGPKSVCVCM